MTDTQPFHRILIAVDADDSSLEAANRGFQLARWLSSEVDCIHAVRPFQVWPEMDEAYVAPIRSSAIVGAREQTQGVIDRAAKTADFEPGDVLRVVEGERSKVILDTADELRADLLVLGRRQSHAPFAFGSTSRAVLAHSHLPTWVQIGPSQAIRNILVPVDFSDHSKSALEYARALATRFEASIEVMHCYSPPGFAYAGTVAGHPGPTYVIEEERKRARSTLDKWMESREWGTLDVSHSFVEGDITREVTKKAEAADLIVMGSHGRTGLTRFLLGSVAYGVLKRSSCPVLVIPSAKRSWLLEAPRGGEAQGVALQGSQSA